MSVRYSNSPSLRLEIVESRLRNVLYGALCLSICYALSLLYLQGNSFLALVLLALVSGLLLRLWREPWVGGRLCWRQGVWSLERADESTVILPLARSTTLPWVIYLSFREPLARRRGSLWIFSDSGDPEQLRRLRVRLTLQRRG